MTEFMKKDLEEIRGAMIVNMNNVASIVTSNGISLPETMRLQNDYIALQVKLIKLYNDLVNDLESHTDDFAECLINAAQKNGIDCVMEFLHVHKVDDYLARMLITVLEFTVLNFKQVVLG